ncbi:MAG: GAF domain-containing protein [Verrucomicrobiota bacterium]
MQTSPDLAKHSASIESQIVGAALEITPVEFRQMIGDAGREALRSTMECLNADALSVWVNDPAVNQLVVTHSEPDEEFVGWCQPLEEGLISLVYVSEQPICENDVAQNTQHSKRTDDAMGQTTAAMLVVPLYLGGNPRGVISCVQLITAPDQPDPPGFTARHINRVRRLSTLIGRLTNYRLLTGLLDIEL